MSTLSDNPTKKSQFPPRKQSSSSTPANSQSKSLTYEECIKNYQSIIKSLKDRILELENRLENSAKVDSGLIELYKYAQIEWNKISEQNDLLKKIIAQEEIPNQRNVSGDLISTNLSLYTENQRLQSELKKKDSIIQSMLKETFSTDAAENQLKKLIDENIQLKKELENANMALSLNNNISALDAFNKILLEKQKTSPEPNEALRIAQEENKKLQEQVRELESEIYEISNNNPELQASLEAEKQLRKLNKELEEKVHKLEIQLKSNKKSDIIEKVENSNKPKSVENNKKIDKISKFIEDDDFDDFDGINDDMDDFNDEFVDLKNTSDEDEDDEDDKFARKKKNEKKEFEFGSDMQMFSAILAPLKKRLDERCRQVEIEKMKKDGVFAPLQVSPEENADENENNLGVELLEQNGNVENKNQSNADSNENNNNNNN